jgi:hypothetical protein
MPLGTGNFFNKLTNINFTVKNNSPNRKIHVFGYPIMPGQTRDLFYIPEISEDDIRSSLVKGELAAFIRNGTVSIVSSSIDLSQYDASQAAFITAAGSSSAYAAGSSTTFVYQPGGVAAGNVYTSFASAWAAMLGSSSLNPTLVIDGTYGSPVMTPGSYAMPPNLTMVGISGLPTLTIPDGAYFTSNLAFIPLIISSLTINYSNTTAPCWTAMAPGTYSSVFLSLTNGSSINSNAASTKVFLAA